jgi:hypothetical protein
VIFYVLAEKGNEMINKPDLKEFRKKLQQQEFRDYIGDRYNIPKDMPPSLRSFCACLKMVDRLKRQDMVWHWVKNEGPIPEQYLPYIDTLLKLWPKDIKRQQEQQSARQVSVFEQKGRSND